MKDRTLIWKIALVALVSVGAVFSVVMLDPDGISIALGIAGILKIVVPKLRERPSDKLNRILADRLSGIVLVNFSLLAGYLLFAVNRPWGAGQIAVGSVAAVALIYCWFRWVVAHLSLARSAGNPGNPPGAA